MPPTFLRYRTRRTPTNCSSQFLSSKQFSRSSFAMPTRISQTPTSVAARTPLAWASSLRAALGSLSTVINCRSTQCEGKERPYGTAEHDHYLYHPAAHPARWPVRLPWPDDVPFPRHHHDCLVWREVRPQRRPGVPLRKLHRLGHDDRLRLCHDAVLRYPDSRHRPQLLSPHHRPDRIPQQSNRRDSTAERLKRNRPVPEPDPISGTNRHLRQYRLHRRSSNHGALGSGRYHHHRLRLRGASDLH